MNNATEMLTEFFDKRGWSYKFDERRYIFSTGIGGENGYWRCLASIGQNGEHIAFMSLFPSKVMPKRRQACAELLTRINFSVTHGCFELDFDDGEIRFRTSVWVTEAGITLDAVECLVLTNLFTVDRYYAAIMRVLHADIPPQKALSETADPLAPHPRFELN